MDTHDGAVEADVGLDGEALRRHESKSSETKGQKKSQVASGGIQIPVPDEGAQEHSEESPLLQTENGGGDDDNGEGEQWDAMEEFKDLPWYKRPSIFFVLGPFFLMACAFGGIITPKLNLILELICARYMSERKLADPNFTMIPVDFQNGNNSQCRIPEVQSAVAQFTLWGGFIAGVLSAITSPKLGALSDRYGRKKILVLTSAGTISGEIITICAAKYPETFPVNLLLLAYALDGLTGSFIVAMIISNAYATDCTPPARRNVAFGYFHGCLFTGIALGPIVAGYIVKKTGQIVIVFYILVVVHLFFVTFVALVVPESLSKKRQMLAREKHEREKELGRVNAMSEFTPEWVRGLNSLNLLAPLKVLWPTGPGSGPAVRRNLFLLAAVDTIVFGVAMGSMTVIIIYTNYMFGWESYESGRFLTIVNSSRVVCLLIILPLLTRWVYGKNPKKEKNTGCDTFDLSIIRTAVLFDTLGYLGYTLSRSGGMMIMSGAVAAIGGIGSPTLQSALTKHVPAGKTGQLLGASGLLHALARVIAPTIFNAIYAGTVAKFPQTVFVCLTATFGLAFCITWALRPKVYFDEAKAAQAESDARDGHSVSTYDDGTERLPIVGSVVAVFSVFFAWLRISG